MENNDMLDLLFHLLFGFVIFLERNFARVNYNLDTLVPGLVAYGFVIMLLHRKLLQFCRTRGRTWSFRSSIQVAMLLPAVFCISLLIPGIMLQLQELAANR